MNRLLLIFSILLFCSFTSVAKIWRVNNNNGIVADFRTIQEAHNGASAGDTLHIEGSPNDYGGLQSSKKLVIIGPGFFLDDNPGLQASTLSAKLSFVYYYEGSEGSEIMGIDFSNNSIYLFCSNIRITRNKFTSNSGDPESAIGGITLYSEQTKGIPVTNIVISQNFGLMINIQQASSGILIGNNYIVGPTYYSVNDQILRQHADAVSILQNNIFKRGRIYIYNSNVSNNIMHSGSIEGSGNLFNNNIGSESQFGDQNGNKVNVDMSTIFEGVGSADGAWKLKLLSVAKGAGYGSTEEKPIDCGIYGGVNPYVTSGVPPIPSIYFFENQPIGSSTDPIDVNIKVRSNN